MAPYGLILKLDEAIWVRIISIKTGRSHVGQNDSTRRTTFPQTMQLLISTLRWQPRCAPIIGVCLLRCAGSGYSLFGSSPWQALHVGVGSQSWQKSEAGCMMARFIAPGSDSYGVKHKARYQRMTPNRVNGTLLHRHKTCAKTHHTFGHVFAP